MSGASIGSPSKVSSSGHDPQPGFKVSKVINSEPPLFRLASPHPIGCYSYTLQTGADYVRGPASSGFAPPDSPAKAKVRGCEAPNGSQLMQEYGIGLGFRGSGRGGG